MDGEAGRDAGEARVLGEPPGQPLGDQLRRATLFGFQLAQGDGRTAHLPGEFVLREVERPPALPEPVPE